MTLQPVFSKLYPEGSVGGECGVFAHNLVDFPPVGNTYFSKKQAVRQNGITADILRGNFAVGDVVITSEGTFMGFGAGHVCVINTLSENLLTLTESNFHKDHIVHHTRQLLKTDSRIFGVIRGPFKFPFTVPPIQITMTILMNNQPLWNSLLAKMAELQDWYYRLGGIELIIDYKDVNLSGWGYQIWGPGSTLEIMDKGFMDSKIAPLSTSTITLFVARSADWNKPTDALTETDGYCWTDNGRIKAYIVADENEVSANYFGLNAFFDYARHEIAHGIYALSSTFDYCHPRYYGLNGYPKDFNQIFEDFNNSLLSRSI